MKKLLSITAIAILSGCMQSGYKQFYNSTVNARELPNVELLGPDEEPKIYSSNNIDRDVQILRSKRYIVVGYSSFNGGYEDTENAVDQAKRIGATAILTNSQYTNTQSHTSALLLPNNQTTYHSGSVYSGVAYGGYSGTSTTYGTTVVPYTTHQRRYDQLAVYFVKSNEKLRYGISVVDLPPDMRVEIERNTGALIDVVMEDTPAFKSNVLAGDVLISIDGQLVKNSQHAIDIMEAVPESQPYAKFLVIRKNEEISIKVNF